MEVNNSTNSEEEVKGLNLQLGTLKSKMSVLLKLMYQFHETPQDGKEFFYSSFFFKQLFFIKKKFRM